MPTVQDVLSNPHLAHQLSQLERAALIVQCSSVLAVLGASMSVVEPPDRLVDAKTAAQRIHRSVDWLRRHARRQPFYVKTDGRGHRFSTQGIDLYLTQQSKERA